ncbi:MAG: hypothetical protein Q7T91_08170 [Sulfuricurvum sp.]|nr:hypothetical protein [Sulfuricurvum sp.]
MGYLVWFGIVAVAFVWMHYFTALTGKQKGIVSLILAMIVGNAILYNIMNDLESKHVAAIELKFTNGETLVCSKVKVNNKNFTYSVGTQSFIGNEKSHYAQQIFSASECE